VDCPTSKASKVRASGLCFDQENDINLSGTGGGGRNGFGDVVDDDPRDCGVRLLISVLGLLLVRNWG
jgi:hypothetical protein